MIGEVQTSIMQIFSRPGNRILLLARILNGVVGKAQVQKVLNQLAETKEVQQKLYGKQSVYVITQVGVWWGFGWRAA